MFLLRSGTLISSRWFGLTLLASLVAGICFTPGAMAGAAGCAALAGAVLAGALAGRHHGFIVFESDGLREMTASGNSRRLGSRDEIRVVPLKTWLEHSHSIGDFLEVYRFMCLYRDPLLTALELAGRGLLVVIRAPDRFCACFASWRQLKELERRGWIRSEA